MDKSDLLEHAQNGAVSYIDSEIAFRRATKYLEQREYDAAKADLEECVDHLEVAISELEAALDVARAGRDEDWMRIYDEGDAERMLAQREAIADEFELLERKHEVGDLFLDDEESWEYLKSLALSGTPMAGYGMMRTMMTRIRNHVLGIVDDVEAGKDPHHMHEVSWRANRLYMRTTNFGNMMTFINRETRESDR